MPGPYPGTMVPFTCMPLPEIMRVAEGPGHAGVSDSGYAYLHLARALRDAASGLRAAMTDMRGAHEGAAAEAAQRHVERLALLGEAGEAEAQLSMSALIDHAGYVADTQKALRGMAAPAAPLTPDPTALAAHQAAVEEARLAAGMVAARYQDNSNASYQGSWRPFDPPQAATPDTGAGPATAAAGRGAGGAAAVAPAGAALAAAAEAGGTPAGVGAVPDAATGAPVGTAVAGAGAGAAGVSASGAPRGSGTSGEARPAAGPGGAAARTAAGGTRVGPGAAGTGPGTAVPLRTSPRTAGAAHVDTPLTTWRPGQSWSARSTLPVESQPRGAARGGGTVPGGGAPGDGAAPGGGAVRHLAAPAPGAPPTPPRAGAPEVPHGAAAARAAAGSTHMPFLPGAGSGGGGRDGERARPPWLLEDDPEAVWFAGLAAHTEPVIGGER